VSWIEYHLHKHKKNIPKRIMNKTFVM